MKRISSRAIIFKEDQVLLMFRRKRQKDGTLKEYYVVPGGGWEGDETLENNAIRELKEEMNIDIAITNFVGLEVTEYGCANYFLAEILKGIPQLGGEEKEKNCYENFYEPQYISISQLDKFDVVGKDFIKRAFNGQFENLSNATLTDQGICPTCYDKKFGNILFGDNSKNLIYVDDDVEIFMCANPRAEGHVIISTIKHFKDMMEIDDEICKKVFLLAKKTMNAIKDVYKSQSVYLCTMCDGPNNHFHLQLIPRYEFEKRGSINFVKERQPYIYDELKINLLRNILKKEQ